MSITVVSSNKVYASIEDLSENMGISDGDRFLLQTDGGTVLFDYENLRIDLEHTTFGTAFSDMQQFQSTVADFVERITDEFTTAQNDVAILRTDVNTIQSQIDSIKLMLKLILGYKNGSSEESIDLEKAGLGVDGQNYMTEVYDTIRDGIDADFSLTSNNLMNIRKKLTSSDGTSLSDGLDTLKENIDAQDKVIADLGTSVAMVKDLANKSWLTSALEKNVFNVAGNVLNGLVKCVSYKDNTGFVILNDMTGQKKDYLVVQFGRIWSDKDYKGGLDVPFKVNLSNVDTYFALAGTEIRTDIGSVTCGHRSVSVSERHQNKIVLVLTNDNAKAATNHVGYFKYNWIVIGFATAENCKSAVENAGFVWVP